MSDLPIEHRQTVDCLKGFRGKVLVGGLGLGLAVTLLERKKSVKEITVVELNQEVIDLVFPHLKTKKTKVVKADLLEFLKTTNDKWDYGFYDIWASDGEGTFFSTVYPLLQLSHKKVKTVRNWNENVMRGQLAMSLNQRYMMNLRHAESFKVDLKKMRPLWELDPDSDNVWHNWMVPFFKWVHETSPEETEIDLMAQLYAHHYGNPDWEKIWEKLRNLSGE
jgi:hypothetical protein